ncbi:NTP transferase domain-containing protein [Anaerotruncus colihominis]|uniref:NTP transferase domain-containing protein n=1 Tax=Anaerotruncus colihominis TaxID=169435 RepID=UPI0024B11C19|nr:NTP transferase domain-containing protein [Anaerotruncus colihominis]
MTAGAMIVADGTTSQGELTRPLEKLGSVSVAQRMVDTFRHAGVDRIVLVSQQENRQALEKNIARTGAICLSPPNGGPVQMFSLVRTGLSYLADKCERVLVAPVDVPLFTPKTVCALLASDGQIVSPLYEGHPGHPLLLASRLAPGILAYEGGDGLRGALRRFADRRIFLPVDDSGVLFNLAREADVAQQLERHNRARLYPDIKVRLMREQAFFGPGVAQLLTLIDETGSVRLACGRMGVSYSKGWKMLSVLEEETARVMVARQQGGKNGGAARLTPDGRALLEKFRLLESRSRVLVQEVFDELFATQEL